MDGTEQTTCIMGWKVRVALDLFPLFLRGVERESFPLKQFKRFQTFH